MWWAERPGLVKTERAALADLEERSDWLTDIRWHFGPDARLAVDVTIIHGEHRFPVTMIYTAFHPFAPPTVTPTDNRRISGHQYGVGGELCLEHRADNWEPDVTGAMMIESAYRLISGERSGIEAGPVPSAHASSQGRALGGSIFRLVLTEAAARALANLKSDNAVDVVLLERRHGGTTLSTPTSIAEREIDSAWTQGEGFRGGFPRTGRAVRLPRGVALPCPVTAKTIAELLLICGFAMEAESFARAGDFTHLLLASDTGTDLLFGYDAEGGGRGCATCQTIVLPADTGSRNPEEYERLMQKSIAIVGCGSLGSKVATSLARAGVGRFVLVDDDIFLPGNLVRNDLDRQAVGVHKVDAIKTRIADVATVADVSVRRLALGGQESAGSTESAMAEVAACDVVVDATADAHCFNFCASVARAHGRPMVWAEVLAGGIGGIIARVRPGYEPDPQRARNQIVGWCTEKGVPAPFADEGDHYAGSVNGIPLIADDSEVSVIAAHTTRMILDVLLRPDTSIFTEPAYAVGLRSAWIFKQPFDTWPITFGHPTDWSIAEPAGSVADTIALIKELMPDVDNHGDPAAGTPQAARQTPQASGT